MKGKFEGLINVNHAGQLTPKALANFSPGGWSAATTLSINPKYNVNPERVRQLPNPFRVYDSFSFVNPGFSLRSNPGLQLANAFGVN
ncbi:MAG TPA: hypothetical protein VLB46_22960 [Pyrinomonadaceae bacterium]|nr:hypothetical protein [Pyrinomonadaceae bacterium]